MSKSVRAKLTEISMAMLAFYPILDYYYFVDNLLTYANIAGLILFITSLFYIPNKQRLPKTYIIYWIYSAFNIYFIAGIGGWSDYLPGGVNLIIFTLTMYALAQNFSFPKLYKYLKWIFLFASVLFLIQFSVFYLTGYKMAFFLPLGNSLSYVGFTYSELINLHHEVNGELIERFSSIFTEPSHFAQFSLILLTIELFDEEHATKLYTKLSIFICLILLLLQSGAGLLGMLFLYIVKILYIIVVVRQYKYFFLIILIVPIIAFGISRYLDSTQGAYVAGRLEQMSNTDETETSSTFVRLYYGWYAFGYLDTFHKLFGISRSYLANLREGGGFFNGITQILCLQGIIGLLLLSLFHLYCCKKKPFVFYAIFLLFVQISLIGGTYLTSIMMLCTTILYGSTIKKLIYEK